MQRQAGRRPNAEASCEISAGLIISESSLLIQPHYVTITAHISSTGVTRMQRHTPADAR